MEMHGCYEDLARLKTLGWVYVLGEDTDHIPLCQIIRQASHEHIRRICPTQLNPSALQILSQSIKQSLTFIVIMPTSSNSISTQSEFSIVDAVDFFDDAVFVTSVISSGAMAIRPHG